MAVVHAEIGMSAAEYWSSCTARIQAQRGIPNLNSDASRLGTTCHQIQEEVLLNPELTAQDYLGRVLNFYGNGKEAWEDDLNHGFCDSQLEARVTVTQDMIDAVDRCVFYVREQLQLRGGRLFVEVAVPIDHITGEEGARGYADVVIMGDTWMMCLDSKFGRKVVKASTVLQPSHKDVITGEDMPEVRRPNLQMSGYTSGALRELDVFGEVRDVTMVIMQPYIDNFDSYSCSVDELNKTISFLREKAHETRTKPQFVPTFENCFFCRAKDRCEARNRLVLESVLDGFEDVEVATPKPVDLPTLGTQYALIPLVEDWCKSVEAAVRKELYAGNPVVRSDGLSYHLAAGKSGVRKWQDPEVVVGRMLALGLDSTKVFTKEVISPAAAEKLTKGIRGNKNRKAVPPEITAEQWAELQQLIIQNEGAPVIVLETSNKPALSRADGFEDVPAPQDVDLASLFADE